MSLKDDITVLPSSTQDELNKGSTCEECAEALSDYIIKLEADNALLKDKVKELEVNNGKLLKVTYDFHNYGEVSYENDEFYDEVQLLLTTIDGKGLDSED